MYLSVGWGHHEKTEKKTYHIGVFEVGSAVEIC